MFISVSMNPSVDKLIHLKELKPRFLNRVSSSSVTAGGKGINVANDLCAFTKDIVLTGFIGTSNNEILGDCTNKLVSSGVTVEYVEIDDRNRTNIKIIENNGCLTEINEPGFLVSIDKIRALREILLKYANKDNTFLLTGSLPRGVDEHFYADITKELKEKGAKVCVDASGLPLKYAVEALPYLIKPNQDELLELFEERNVSEKLVIKMARELCQKGINHVIVSRGSLGSVFISKEQEFKCPAVTADVCSTVGAGDSMFAIFAYALSSGMTYEECIKLSVAAATHTVALSTPFIDNSESVKELCNKVKLTEIN